MTVPYVCCIKQFEDHYTQQAGFGLPYYQSGITFQKGYGLGGIFKSLFRAALPFLTRGAKTVGREALITGARVASDMLEGSDLKTSVKKRVKESGKILAKKAVDKAKTMIGGKYKRKRQASTKNRSRKVRKVKGRDIFDT